MVRPDGEGRAFFRPDFRTEENDDVIEVKSKREKFDVKVEVEFPFVEFAVAQLPRSLCEASSEQFSEVELSPVDPVEP